MMAVLGGCRAVAKGRGGRARDSDAAQAGAMLRAAAASASEASAEVSAHLRAKDRYQPGPLAWQIACVPSGDPGDRARAAITRGFR
jgi:hypothetical protein